MTITIFPACALFAWIFVLSDGRRLPTIRREPERLTVWLMFLAFALVFTIGSSPLRRHLDGFAGVTEFSTWLLQSLVTAYSLAALALLELWNYEPARARRRVVGSTTAVAGVLVVMAALFFLSNTVHAGNHDFVHWYGSSAYFDAYLVLYLVTFTATNVEIARLCRRFARVMTRCWLRTGLRTTAVGALVSLVYVADRLMDIVVARMGIYLPAADMVAQAGAGFGSMLVMIGLSMHMWGPRASELAHRRRRMRLYRQLYPLWVALYARDPGISLEAASADSSRWRRMTDRRRGFDYRVSRRVIEVRDGLLALRPYLDKEIARSAREAATGLVIPAEELAAVIEAHMIRAVLTTSEHGGPRPKQPYPVPMNNEPADLDAELAWLSTVSKHFDVTPAPVAPAGATTA